MGDIADMMLDGTLCQECGAVMGSFSEGVPRTCHDCMHEDGAPRGVAPKVACKICGKRVKQSGISDHIRVVHMNKEDSCMYKELSRKLRRTLVMSMFGSQAALYAQLDKERSEAANALDAQSVTVLKLTKQRDELLDKLGYVASCLKTDGTDPIDVAIARIKADL